MPKSRFFSLLPGLFDQFFKSSHLYMYIPNISMPTNYTSEGHSSCETSQEVHTLLAVYSVVDGMCSGSSIISTHGAPPTHYYHVHCSGPLSNGCTGHLATGVFQAHTIHVGKGRGRKQISWFVNVECRVRYVTPLYNGTMKFTLTCIS